MHPFYKRWIALAMIVCLLVPTMLIPGSAEDQSPEGDFIPEAQVKKDEDWVDEKQEEPEENQPSDTQEQEKPSGEEEENPSEEEENTSDENQTPEEETQPEPDAPVEKVDEEEEDRVYQWKRPEELGRVPLMLQTDYPNVPYGDGSVATSGCTMACVAMVATYLKGEVIKPDELAKRFRTADGSHLQRMEAASIVLDLEFHKTLYAGNVVKALKQGKVVIIMVESKSDFTNTQHLMVCTEILPDGRIMVNDPLGTNYRKPELEEGFMYGFTQEQLFTGFSGAWIYEFYKEPQVGPTNYPDLVLTQEEKDVLARLIWREARGEPFKGQQAVAEVVLNRVISERFPTNDVISTIYAQDQFRTAKFLNDTVADELQYKAIEKALAGPNVLPRNVYYFSRVARNSNIWGQIGNHVFCGSA